MGRGGKRIGAGKKPGSKNRYSKELAARLEASGAMTPLDLFTCVVHDGTVSIEARIMAAKAAAPFVHRRKPQALEITGRFEFLSPEERELRRKLLLEEIRGRLVGQGTPSGN